MILFIIFLLAFTLPCPTGPAQATANSSPYPSSPLITSVTFDWASFDQQAPGSDNWPVTWAADGHQYTAWGDGGGFTGTDTEGRVSLGIARLKGEWDHFKGYNVWGGKDTLNSAQFDGKSYGILSIDGKLYLWVSPGSGDTNYTEARLAQSTDLGANWTKASWAFKEADGLVLPTFLQFGKDYAGARDGFVYSYAIRLVDNSSLKIQKPGQIDLLRVPKQRLMERNAYEYFAGLDGRGEPTWTMDLTRRRAVFEDRGGVGWTVSATYNAGLTRYLLMTEHGESFKGNLGIFDAPNPWGPWTTVTYQSNWGGYGELFFWTFSNKWTSTDGRDFTLIFTGLNRYDAWNTVHGTFKPDAGQTPIPARTP